MLIFYTSSGQKIIDTVLGEIKIKGKYKQKSSDERINSFITGQNTQKIDSITLQQYNLQNVATLISQQLPVFVKSYSFNGLATLHFRGASAAQSQVLWNGVPIQNAALGMADISTVPVLFMSKVNVIYGSSGALLGSGNVGGALMLYVVGQVVLGNIREA
jgi:outer membrane cobalamin receptor